MYRFRTMFLVISLVAAVTLSAVDYTQIWDIKKKDDYNEVAKEIKFLLSGMSKEAAKISTNCSKIDRLIYKSWSFVGTMNKDYNTLKQLFTESLGAFDQLSQNVEALKNQMLDPTQFCFAQLEARIQEGGNKYNEAHEALRGSGSTLESLQAAREIYRNVDFSSTMLLVNQLYREIYAVAPPMVLGKILFESEEFGDWDIFIMDENGSNRKRLTNSTTNDFNPTLSPDGEWIAYCSKIADKNYELRIMDINGNNSRAIAHNTGGFTACFTPDCTRIVYSDDGIHIMDLDGSNSEKLTSYGYNADVSPDGSRIVFSSWNCGVYIMNIDGSDLTCITKSGENRPLEHDPVFTPDGQKIVYCNQRKINDDYHNGVAIMNADGSDKRVLWEHDDAWSMDGVDVSPDGKNIVFSVRIWDVDDNSNLHVMSINGSGHRRLTNWDYGDEEPCWR